MKQFKIALVLLYLFSVSYVFSQPELSDSTNAYNYWAKRATIEFIYAYMKDYMSLVDSAKISEGEKPGKDKYYSFFIEEIEKKDIEDVDILFDSISIFL